MYSSIKSKFLNNLEGCVVITLALISFFGYLAYFPFDRDIIITPNLFFIRLLVSLSSAGLYCWVLYVIGGCFSKYLSDVRLEDVNYRIFRFVLGICLLSFSYLVLGIAKNLTYNNIFLITSFLFILGFYFSTKYQPKLFKSDIKEHFLLRLSLIPFLFLGILLAGLPEIEWDSAVYHVPAIKEFVSSGVIGIYPVKEPFNFPMAHNLLYFFLLYFDLDSGIACFNLIILLVGIKSLFQVSKLTLRKPYSYLAPFIMQISYFLWINVTTSRVEVALCSYIIVYYLIKLHAFRKNSTNLFFLSLIILGMISATKSTGMIFVVVEIVVIAVSFLTKNGIIRFKKGFSTYLVACSLILLSFPSLYWYGKNQLAFNSFNYPKSALVSKDINQNEFESLVNRTKMFFANSYPKYAELQNSNATFSKVLSKIIYSPTPQNNYDYSLFGLIKNPHVFSYGMTHDLNWFFLFVFIPIYFFSRKSIYIILPFLITLLCIIFKGHLIRYATPLAGLISLLCAFNFQKIEPKQSNHKLLYLYHIIIISLLISYQQLSFTYKYLNANAAFSRFINKISINDYIKKYAYSQGDTSSYLLSEINNRIPANQKVVLIGDNKELYVRPKVIGDFDQLSRQAIPWIRLIDDTNGDQRAIYNNLKKNGINYIAVNLKYYERHYSRTRFYEEHNIRLRTLDRCHTTLLKNTLTHLNEFLRLFGRQIYKNQIKKIFIFKIV